MGSGPASSLTCYVTWNGSLCLSILQKKILFSSLGAGIRVQMGKYFGGFLTVGNLALLQDIYSSLAL